MATGAFGLGFYQLERAMSRHCGMPTRMRRPSCPPPSNAASGVLPLAQV